LIIFGEKGVKKLLGISSGGKIRKQSSSFVYRLVCNRFRSALRSPRSAPHRSLSTVGFTLIEISEFKAAGLFKTPHIILNDKQGGVDSSLNVSS
jgi:hypothetical protein